MCRMDAYLAAVGPGTRRHVRCSTRASPGRGTERGDRARICADGVRGLRARRSWRLQRGGRRSRSRRALPCCRATRRASHRVSTPGASSRWRPATSTPWRPTSSRRSSCAGASATGVRTDSSASARRRRASTTPRRRSRVLRGRRGLAGAGRHRYDPSRAGERRSAGRPAPGRAGDDRFDAVWAEASGNSSTICRHSSPSVPAPVAG